MIRRTSLVIAIIGFNLMACCCGGAGNQAKPKPVAIDPEAKAAEDKANNPLPDTPEDFLARFGKADSDKIVDGNRIIRFSGEEICVRFVFEPLEPRKWKFAKSIRDDTDAPLPNADALYYLSNRDAVKLKAKAAAEAAKPRIRRENYNKIKNGMSIEEVEAILGFGTENARSPGFVIVTWERREALKHVIITGTFQNGQLASKAIIGD